MEAGAQVQGARGGTVPQTINPNQERTTMSNEAMEKAKEHFGKVLQEQLGRVERMKKGEEWTDYSKLKPIIMSTLAIILGMMPLALGIGSAGAEMRQPLGIVSIGGLIVSAILTLIVIPTLYNLFGRDKVRKTTQGVEEAVSATD